MKKCTWLMILMVLTLALGSVVTARAEILPPYGEGQIGLLSVVLCEELTVRQSPDSTSDTVAKLQYGDRVIVQQQSDGWAYCALSDSEEDDRAGWVNADYIVVDPAWYRTSGKTPVYAWNSTDAPKVALLGSDATLPILKNEGEWIVVSLRGASGWIHNDDAGWFAD